MRCPIPLYDYECDCGEKKSDVLRSMNALDNPEWCARCHRAMVRQFPLVHTDLQDFHTPIVMHSIGCTSVEQIRQMQEAGVSISTDPNDPDYGTPIAHNRHEKLKALRVAGFVETN